MAAIDLRRFEYPLAPLLLLRRWELDAEQARLGIARSQLKKSQQAYYQLQQDIEGSQGALSKKAQSQLDASFHMRALGWLLHLEARAAAQLQDVQEIEHRCIEHQKICMSIQQKIEVLNTHRSDAVAVYAQAETNRLASESDRDWLSRRAAVSDRKERS